VYPSEPVGNVKNSQIKAERIVCAECGEGLNFRREIVRAGIVLLRLWVRAILPNCYKLWGSLPGAYQGASTRRRKPAPDQCK
jgi:hypothetical protein